MRKIQINEFLGDGFEGYFVLENGIIISTKSGKELPLKPDIDKYGYYIYKLYNPIIKKHKAIKGHRLVAMAFIPNPNNLPIVNHINGIKNDNSVENLEWCTNSKNIQHAFDNKLLVPYTRKYIVKDNKTNEIVCVTHGYSFLMDLLGFSYTYLCELQCDGTRFFDHYTIERKDDVDKNIEESLYNAKFIKRTLNQNFKPVKYNGVVYENLISLFSSGLIKKSEYNKARKNKANTNNKIIHNGKEIHLLTRYEYVNY